MVSLPRTEIRKFQLVTFLKLFRQMKLTFNSVLKSFARNALLFPVDKKVFQRLLSFFNFLLHGMH